MNRPRQHILETISKNALEQIIPDEWVVRSLSPDYGIDFMVEVYKNNKSTGDFFYIQLKGTDQKVKKSKIKVSIKYSTLHYFSLLPLPILFLVYTTNDKKFRGLWINEYIRIVNSKRNQKTISLTLTDRHVIDRDFIVRIENSISMKSIEKINVNIKAKHEISIRYHARLREYIDYYYPDLFVHEQSHFPLNILFNYTYSTNNVFIEVDYNLLGKYKLKKLPIKNDSDFLTYQSTYENIPTELQEAMFLIAVFASRLNIVASLKVLGKVLPFYDGKYKTSTTIADIGLIALDNHKLIELQQLIDILINYKKYNEFQYLMVMFLAQMRKPLPMLEEFYRQNLLKVINSDIDDIFKGTLSYNLANSYRSEHEFYLSAKYYFQARRLNPDYLNRSYWWDEVASILFLTGHFKYAEKFYLKADSMTDRFRPKIYALIGDTLLFQGDFPEARRWFRKYTNSKEGKDSEFHLKLICLKYFKRRFGEIRKRNIKKADEECTMILKNNILTIPKLEEIIKIDPLSGCAWYNYGHLLLENKKEEESLCAYLFCFICENWFPRDASINTLFLALYLKETVLFAQILELISFKFGDSILEDIANALKQNPSIPADGKEFIFQQIKSMLSLAKKGIWRKQ